MHDARERVTNERSFAASLRRLLVLLASGISALGTMEAGQAQSEAAAYQAQVARNNAAIAQQNAGLQVQSGEVQASNQAMATRGAVGTTKAGQAASGVDVNSGSFVGVRSSESEFGALDALTLRSNAARQAYNYEATATSENAKAGLYGFESTQASQAAPISALGTFIGGAGSAAGNYVKATGIGAPNPFGAPNPNPAAAVQTSAGGGDLTYSQFGFNVT